MFIAAFDQMRETRSTQDVHMSFLIDKTQEFLEANTKIYTELMEEQSRLEQVEQACLQVQTAVQSMAAENVLRVQAEKMVLACRDSSDQMQRKIEDWKSRVMGNASTVE